MSKKNKHRNAPSATPPDEQHNPPAVDEVIPSTQEDATLPTDEPSPTVAEHIEPAAPIIEDHKTPELPTRAVMFVQGFRKHHSFICGHGSAGGCRQNVEQWSTPAGGSLIVDEMPGDNSPWMIHSSHCPASNS